MAALTGFLQPLGVNGRTRVVFGQHSMSAVTGMAWRPGAGGRFPSVAIFLFMAAAAIHRTGARRGLMIIIFNQGVAIPADGLFFSVDRGVKFIDRDLKFTFVTADLVAIDAVLG